MIKNTNNVNSKSFIIHFLEYVLDFESFNKQAGYSHGCKVNFLRL